MLNRVWLSDDAKRKAKSKAAEKGLSLQEYLDEVLLGYSSKKKGGGGFW